MIGLMYLGDHLAELPFLPYDLFDWITRVLPGPVVTFGIDLMIDTMDLVGMSVADTAKTAEQIMAVLQFLFIGVVVGTAFFAVIRVREAKPDVVTGAVVGALFGLPMFAITMAISLSTASSAVEVRVDGGLWVPAQLRSPLSDTTWVIWQYDWLFQPGEHTFEVRCKEADGTPMSEGVRDNRPSGATGIHSLSANLS